MGNFDLKIIIGFDKIALYINKEVLD